MRTTSSSAGPLARLSVALLAIALFAACGGGGGGSPTDPGMPALGGSASVEGQVAVDGATSGSLAGSSSSGAAPLPAAGRGPATPGAAAAPTSFSAADSSGAGVTVRVQGTSLATVANADGAFRLSGVPHGNQVLVFETAEASAGLVVEAIQPNETIRMSVRVSGGNAQVTDIDRDGGGPSEGEPEEDEPEGGELDLSLQLSPDTWNLNYDHSAGTVAAFLRGRGFRDVVLGSIVLAGDDPGAEPLEPVDASRQGNNVRARFAKGDVLDLLDEPKNGSVHEVTLRFEVEGVSELQELTTEVRIVGTDDEEDGGEDEEDEELGDLSLQLSPGTWNLNYEGASGHVTAFIRGTGLGAIDTDSVELVGDDPDADPLSADFARFEGHHVRAQFPKNQVLDLLNDPERGSTHTVVVRFTSGDGAESHELEAQVKVVGNDK